MNKTKCPSPDFKLYQGKVLPALYIITFILGLITNTCGWRCLWQKWKKVGNIRVFLLNLGFLNVLYLPTLPFFSFSYIRNKWVFGGFFCKASRFCFNLNLYGSIGFLTCISVYRYLAIVHPMRAMGRLTSTHSGIISVLVWILVSVQSLPDLTFPKSPNGTEKCHHSTSKERLEDYLSYSIGWSVTGCFIPFLIIMGCYGHMAALLCRTNTIDAELKQKSLKLLFVLILLFSVCYLPYHVFRSLTLYARISLSKKICPPWEIAVFNAHQISRGLVCLNSALNPLVYLNVSHSFTAFISWPFQRGRRVLTANRSDTFTVRTICPSTLTGNRENLHFVNLKKL